MKLPRDNKQEPGRIHRPGKRGTEVVYMGLDPAKPGSDKTVVAIRTPRGKYNFADTAKPTVENSDALQNAFDFFNEKLFGNELPQCLVTTHENKRRKAYGYYAHKKMRSEVTGQSIDEIWLNTGWFNRGDRKTLSTLVHEMCHLWQFHHGKAGKHGYHNKQFAAKMKSIGLQCSNTGVPGGKDTGTQMTHYIMDGCGFDVWCNALLDDGFILPYRENWGGQMDVRPDPFKAPKKHPASKTAYTCPGCDAKVWGKPNLNIACMNCNEGMWPDEMTELQAKKAWGLK